jgi:predicted flap endonuclease-1-like 5' DNA nuclease
MSIPAAILLGVLIGWVIEWIIDWVYWRKQSKELKILREENEVLKAQVEKFRPAPDNLKLIKGIGPEIEKRLHEAGILSFQQLGKLRPSKLEAILGSSFKHLTDEVEILEQARELAKKSKSK